MLTLKVLTITPFLTTMFILADSTSSSKSFLDYGALGLCAICILFLCGFVKQLIDKIDKKDLQLNEHYVQNTRAFDRLADLLEDRPCLMKDKRIREQVKSGN